MLHKNKISYQVLQPAPGGYSFCWKLEYLNGLTKTGGWNCDVKDESMQAWRQKSTDMLRAQVIAMDKNRNKKVIAECPGPELFGFEWVYTGRLLTFGGVKARICGLTLLTETERVACYESGQVAISPFSPQLINKYPQGRQE